MNRTSRRLLLHILLFACLFSTNIMATRTEKSTINAPDCVEECAKKRDRTLESCARLSGANKTRCESMANDTYNKCTSNCNNNTAKP